MGSLKGKNILITSGPTRGYIDAVRYISNKSTGKLGVTIATEALKRDASVTFIFGTGSSIPEIALLGNDGSHQLTLIEIETIEDLLTTIQGDLKGKSFDAIVHAMAVLDYSPEKPRGDKIASNKDTLTITLQKTPKVIKQIRALWPRAFLTGFKLETGLSKECLIERAHASMLGSGADLVVANNQNEISADKHRAYLINLQKEVASECETRQDIASNLMDLIAKKL